MDVGLSKGFHVDTILERLEDIHRITAHQVELPLFAQVIPEALPLQRSRVETMPVQYDPHFGIEVQALSLMCQNE